MNVELGPLPLSLHVFSAEHPLAEPLASLAEELSGVDAGEDDAPLAEPALRLRAQDGRRVDYLALPEGPEQKPFRETLAALTNEVTSPIDIEPAELIVFIAAACPHCPLAVSAAAEIAARAPDVTLTVVDAQHYGSLAEAFNVTSVPLTVIDRQLAITGVVPARELEARLRSRGTDAFGAAVLASLVEAGRLDEVAEKLKTPEGLAHFVEAWRTSVTASRIGMMLVIENVLGDDAHALDGAVDSLAKLTRSDDAALRGDTADILGQIGYPSARPALEALLDDPNPDVAEIAEEALEEL